MRPCWALVLIGSILMFPGHAASAKNESLVGIRKMTVAVYLDPLLPEVGVDSTQVLVGVQLALRKVGVQVVDVESTDAWLLPSLYLSANALATHERTVFAVSTEASVLEWATLDRDPRKRSLLASTWHQTYLTLAGRNQITSAVGENFKILADMFLNDYLAANPKMAGGMR